MPVQTLKKNCLLEIYKDIILIKIKQNDFFLIIIITVGRRASIAFYPMKILALLDTVLFLPPVLHKVCIVRDEIQKDVRVLSPFLCTRVAICIYRQKRELAARTGV